jgi:hypothetical protein
MQIDLHRAGAVVMSTVGALGGDIMGNDNTHDDVQMDADMKG